jgi:DEAD/DEAH box helicase domain-containing protein
MKLSSGNAQRIMVGNRLDGPASAFGRVFWKALASDVPLTMNAIKEHGVESAHYTDRYFLTPLNMTLLAQVLAAAPGAPQISITTAHLDRRSDPGFLVFHPFADDGQREKVMQHVWPQAALKLLRPCLVLGDGRLITILLDQGFGGWRSQSAPRHNFEEAPAAQAKAIRSAPYAVVTEARETPFILWEGSEAPSG